jgi:hypothetical protein
VRGILTLVRNFKQGAILHLSDDSARRGPNEAWEWVVFGPSPRIRAE